MQTIYSLYQSTAMNGMLYSDTEPRKVASMIAKEAIAFGCGVAKVIGKDDQVRLPAANQGSLDFVGDLVASNTINLKVNGSAITQVTFNTDHATTMGLIAAAIAAKTTYVTSATVGTARQIIVKGVDNTDVAITDIVVAAGSSQTTGAFTQGTRDPIYGIALRTMVTEAGLPNTDTAPYYPTNDVVNTLRKGQVYAYFETAFNPDTDTLYCRFLDNGTGKTPGQFLNSSDSGKAVACGSAFQVKSTLSGAGLAVIEINNPSKA